MTQNDGDVPVEAPVPSAPEGMLGSLATLGTMVSEDATIQLMAENVASAPVQTELSVAFAYAALLADNDAFRARLEREKLRVIEAEKVTLAEVLLDSVDALEQALGVVKRVTVAQSQGVRDLTLGVQLSLNFLYKRLSEIGAERMTTTGQRFDPRFAETVDTIRITDPAQDGIIMQEIRPGYRVGEHLLRRARVRVGRVT